MTHQNIMEEYIFSDVVSGVGSQCARLPDEFTHINSIEVDGLESASECILQINGIDRDISIVNTSGTVKKEFVEPVDITNAVMVCLRFVTNGNQSMYTVKGYRANQQ